MLIKYYVKQIYGLDHRIIEDNNIRAAVQVLTGNKGIRTEDIRALEMLGHTLEQVLPPQGAK